MAHSSQIVMSTPLVGLSLLSGRLQRRVLSNVARIGALLMLALFVSISGVCQQLADSKINTADNYLNNPQGLNELLNHLLLTAKNGDEAKLRSLVAEMEIPNYGNWFPSAFGQEKGHSRADLYRRALQTSELHFQMLLTELARQDGEVSIEKTDIAKKYGTSANSLDEYKASWKKTDASPGPDVQTIGFFYFVDERFRLDGSVHEVRVLSPDDRGPVVPAKLINKVQPVYSKEAVALKIQGIVSINVVVKKDGTVKVQNVGAGHPLLAPAAVDAVQLWRYEPTTVGGEPVDVETKVYVTFALKRRNEP